MESNQNSQAVLENQYKKQQNFFYESISTKLKAYSEDQTHLLKLLNAVQEDNISVEHFEVLGCFSYLVGIDYVNQSDLKEEIVTKVRQRFEIFNFSEEILEAYSVAIKKVTEKNIQSAKDKLKNQILDELPVNTKDKLLFNNLRANIKKIFNNSIVPVSMSVAINELLNKSMYTFHDVLTINSAINVQCKFLGKHAVKNLIKVISDPKWIDYLNAAKILFDNQKFAVVYFDGILSVKESENKLARNIYQVISKTTDFDKIVISLKSDEIVEIETVEKDNIVVKESSDKIYQKISDEEMSRISKEEPITFIYHVFCETLQHYPETIEEIIDCLPKLFDEEDYIQHIYHYMKKQGNLVKVGDGFPESPIKISSLVEKFDSIIIEMREEYKKSLESICENIDESKIHKIVSYINICIGDLVLSTDDQKQYLTSQLIENNISTYQHLMQMMELIENSDILGEQMISYVVLYKYLESIPEIKEKFELSRNTEKLQIKLSIYIGFYDFFKKTIEELPVSEK